MDDKELLLEAQRYRERFYDQIVKELSDSRSAQDATNKRVEKNEKWILRIGTIFATIIFILEIVPKLDKFIQVLK